MSNDTVLLEVDGRGVAYVTLNRPDVHNAFNEDLIGRLGEIVDETAERDDVRMAILTGAGKSFSAGADLNWMKRQAERSKEENEADTQRFGSMLMRLHRHPRPWVALVNGAAYGGGVGLVAACDIAVADENARFCLSEVKLGLIPGVISPYVVRAMGRRQAHRWFLTAEVFDAETAEEIGLVHRAVDAGDLEETGEHFVQALLECGPEAHGRTKDLIHAVSDRPVDEEMVADTARRIAETRASSEGQEGIASFLEKRPPAWRQR